MRMTASLPLHRTERRDSLTFGKKKKPESTENTVAVPQTGKSSHPFLPISSYIPGGVQDVALYRSLREAVPIIDAAIEKLVRLLGTFSVKAETDAAQKSLERFLCEVDVGGTRKGIYAFISTFFGELLTCGTAVGEIVADSAGIRSLYIADLRNISLSAGASPLDIIVSVRDKGGCFVPVKYPGLILKCVHNPEPGKIYGTSVLKGLPFVADVLLEIYNTIRLNWERVGNVRFAVTYKPQNDTLDRAYAKERAKQVANEWRKAMEKNGPVKDFVAVGDVEIKAIGADNQILESEVPVRQMLEQIVAKLGIPPFLLGLSWSTTERMSSQQADILTSEIEAYQREIEPVIRQICKTHLLLSGLDCNFSIEWNDITLQDIAEIAKSEYYKAQSKKILAETKGVKNGNE